MKQKVVIGTLNPKSLSLELPAVFPGGPIPARRVPVRTFALRAHLRLLFAVLPWHPCVLAAFALVALQHDL